MDGALSLHRVIVDCIASIRRTFLQHLPLYLCAALFYAMAWALLARYGLPLPLSSCTFFLGFVADFLALWVCALAAWDLFQVWRSGSPGRPLSILAQRMAQRLTTGDRAGNGFHALVVTAPMTVVSAAMKVAIPTIRPFDWDTTFVQWDRMLGFGHLPHEILGHVLNFMPITVGLNFLYDAWFTVMLTILIWQSFSARGSQDRLQYLLAYTFAWFFGGSLLAIVFSSVGPCFYDYLYPGPSPYAEQMAYLRHIGPGLIWSLDVQDELWRAYSTGQGNVSGISAMPSMHVTIAVLVALIGWRTNRRLGIALTAFAAAIMLGSVHLLWHYAVDGIAGAGVALLCWFAAGQLSRRWCNMLEGDAAAPMRQSSPS